MWQDKEYKTKDVVTSCPGTTEFPEGIVEGTAHRMAKVIQTGIHVRQTKSPDLYVTIDLSNMLDVFLPNAMEKAEDPIYFCTFCQPVAALQRPQGP